jgi:ubiquinone/menaquinone biosynthesis C-methylase UbiE
MGTTLHQNTVSEIEDARKYAGAHKKYAGLMFGGTCKRINACGKSGRYLDMGAGPGFMAVMLAQSNPDITITAVDISPEMAEVGNDYIKENGLEERIEYLVGDVLDAETMQGLGEFDVVYSTFSLHCWNEPEKAIRNLWKVTAPGGVLLIHDFKKMGWLRFLPFKSGEKDAMMAALSDRKIRTILKRTGATDFSIRTTLPFVLHSIIARKQPVVV